VGYVHLHASAANSIKDERVWSYSTVLLTPLQIIKI